MNRFAVHSSQNVTTFIKDGQGQVAINCELQFMTGIESQAHTKQKGPRTYIPLMGSSKSPDML